MYTLKKKTCFNAILFREDVLRGLQNVNFIDYRLILALCYLDSAYTGVVSRRKKSG